MLALGAKFHSILSILFSCLDEVGSARKPRHQGMTPTFIDELLYVCDKATLPLQREIGIKWTLVLSLEEARGGFNGQNRLQWF